MKRPHAQIHLPTLTAHDALALVDVLERAIAALWRTHGDDMAELQAARGIETPRPPGAVWTTSPSPDDDCF
jgi:hypothetical protein